MNMLGACALIGMERKMTLNEVWSRICRLQGAIFKTVKGHSFDYIVDGNGLFIFRDGRLINRRLTLTDVLNAAERCPLETTTEIADCLGPSYLFGILMDPRVRSGLW